MSLDIDQIAEAFCSYRFTVTYPYMADKIKWNIVGQEELVDKACLGSFVSASRTAHTAKKVLHEPGSDTRGKKIS